MFYTAVNVWFSFFCYHCNPFTQLKLATWNAWSYARCMAAAAHCTLFFVAHFTLSQTIAFALFSVTICNVNLVLFHKECYSIQLISTSYSLPPRNPTTAKIVSEECRKTNRSRCSTLSAFLRPFHYAYFYSISFISFHISAESKNYTTHTHIETKKWPATNKQTQKVAALSYKLSRCFKWTKSHDWPDDAWPWMVAESSGSICQNKQPTVT